MDIPLEHFQFNERPWGNFKRFTLNESSTVKIVTVHPLQALSLQKHHHRKEFWYVLSGSGTFTIGEEKIVAEVGGGYLVPTETLHRVEAGNDGLMFLEIAFGDFDEDDIVRIEDRYGRK